LPLEMVSQLFISDNSFSAGIRNDEGSTLCFAEILVFGVGARTKNIIFGLIRLYQA